MTLAEQLASPDEPTRLRAAQALEAEETDEAAQLLAGALGDESWRVRRVAVTALAQRGGPDAVAALLRALRAEHQDLGVLNSALQVLALIDLDVLTPLVEFLSDPDADLRIYAALALGEQGDPGAIPALIRALDDPDANVRYHAVEALGKLRAAEAVDRLVGVAESGDFFLAFPALDALKRIGDARAAERLVPLLRDDLLRAPAAEALGRLGDDQVTAPLIAVLNSPGAPASAIAGALAAVHDRLEEQYGQGEHVARLARDAITPTGEQNLLDAVDQAGAGDLRGLVIVLGWLEGAAVQRALARLLSRPAARKEVMEAVVRYGRRITGLLAEQLDAEDLETRQAAAVALGRIGDGRAAPALTQALTSEAELAIVAAGALARIGDQSALDALIGQLGHPSAAVRKAVVAAVNSLGHPDTAKRMAMCLRDADPRVRESAVKIAGYFGFAECVDLLFERCRDEDGGVRRAAIEHVPFLEDERALDVLAGAVQNETPDVRAAAARALAQIEASDARPHLFAALRDSDPWVRFFAARSVAQHGYPDALDVLERLVKTDRSPQVRIAALEALGQIGGARAVTILAPFATADDDDMARVALRALGETGQSDARPALLAALRSPAAARRIDAVRALGEQGGVGVAGALQQVAATDADAGVAQTAIDALAHLATPEAIDALIALTEDSERREAGIAALAQLGDEQLDQVAEGLEHPRAEVRGAVVAALARMKTPRAAERLTRALYDAEASVRLAAVNALARVGSRHAQRKLAELAHADPDAGVRRAAQAALEG